MQRIALSAAGLLGAAALSGCGSHSSAAGFSKQADARCAADHARLAAVPRPASILRMQGYLAHALPILEAQRKAVGEISGADSAKAKALLATWDRVLASSHAAATASAAGDDARLVFAMRSTHAAKLDADAAARAAGATACTGFSPFEYDKR